MRTLTKATVLGALGIGAGLLVGRVVTGRHPVGNRAVAEPAKPVDLNRYLGRWYEIARYDQSFERGCIAVTADYALRPDGKISVVNTCRRTDGGTRVAKAKAIVADAATNAKLKVSFWGPLYIGDYWVLDHADDYSWSIVGDPSGRYLWLLCREADPDSSRVEDLIRRAETLGYDISYLKRSPHP